MIAPAKPPFRLPPAVWVARDLALAVRTRKVAAGLFFLAALAAVAVGIMLCPRTYQSEAKLYVRLGRESVTLDPTATTGQTISVHESRENEINSVLDTLQSRVIYATVVDRLGPEAVLKGGPLPKPGDAKAKPPEQFDRPKGGLLTAVGLSDPMSAREMAISSLAKSVAVSAAKKSNVITLTAKASSPELAQRFLDEVIAAFLEKHAEVNRTAGSYEFFVEQTDMARREYEAAAAELAKAKNALGVGTVETKRLSVQAQIAALETDLLGTGKQLSAAEASIASKRRLLAQLPATVLAQQVAGSPNSAADQTSKQLAELKLQEQTLRMRYQPAHPLVVAAGRRIERAEELLVAMSRGSLQETNAPNPARQQLEIQLLADEAQADGLRAQSETLGRQLADARRALDALNANEGRLTVLESRRDSLAATLKDYAAKLEQARLDRALGAEQIVNVNVSQRPTFVARPLVPNKRLIFLAGLVFAATGAVGLAIGLEYWPVVRNTFLQPAPADTSPTSPPPTSTFPTFDRRRAALQEV